MNFLRRQPTPEDISASGRKVIETLHETGLPPEFVLIMGGAALALAGIRPTNDVDIKVPYHPVYADLVRSGHTPSGVPMHRKPGALRPFLETTPIHLPEHMMSVDVIYPHGYREHTPSSELDAAFLAEIEGYEQVDGFRVLPPLEVARYKNRHHGEMPISRKDRRDIRLIEEHLNNQ